MEYFLWVVEWFSFKRNLMGTHKKWSFGHKKIRSFWYVNVLWDTVLAPLLELGPS